ncbi:hypothetical protein NE237_007014 [Protea cynaroides]|uniref:Uncharacterized protein n=1 Tax=Protea cynaroides TaxID=273540 RepID=A0A9Q0QVQ4_9MAGN|nr:hypothetical protein NE237_007014 [Protea cynaroides]
MTTECFHLRRKSLLLMMDNDPMPRRSNGGQHLRKKAEEGKVEDLIHKPPPLLGYHDSFSADDKVPVHHVSHSLDSIPPSPEIYEFADVNLDYSSSPFSGMPRSNGNGKHYGIGNDDDGIFTSNEAMFPLPEEMQCRRWRLPFANGTAKNAIHLRKRRCRTRLLKKLRNISMIK